MRSRILDKDIVVKYRVDVLCRVNEAAVDIRVLFFCHFSHVRVLQVFLEFVVVASKVSSNIRC